jgi:hypothetical protein
VFNPPERARASLLRIFLILLHPPGNKKQEGSPPFLFFWPAHGNQQLPGLLLLLLPFADGKRRP